MAMRQHGSEPPHRAGAAALADPRAAHVQFRHPIRVAELWKAWRSIAADHQLPVGDESDVAATALRVTGRLGVFLPPVALEILHQHEAIARTRVPAYEQIQLPDGRLAVAYNPSSPATTGNPPSTSGGSCARRRAPGASSSRPASCWHRGPRSGVRRDGLGSAPEP
jgi:hypothetical protein